MENPDLNQVRAHALGRIEQLLVELNVTSASKLRRLIVRNAEGGEDADPALGAELDLSKARAELLSVSSTRWRRLLRSATTELGESTWRPMGLSNHLELGFPTCNPLNGLKGATPVISRVRTPVYKYLLNPTGLQVGSCECLPAHGR